MPDHSVVVDGERRGYTTESTDESTYTDLTPFLTGLVKWLKSDTTKPMREIVRNRLIISLLIRQLMADGVRHVILREIM